MDKEDLNQGKYISLMKIKSPSYLLTLKNNKSFCNKFFEQSMITAATDEPDYFDESNNLIYDVSRSSNFDAEAFRAIIDLLMQLRAAGNDQNVFIQNNTVVREQILSQLKNEILKVNHKLTHNQIKNLEVISSNSFDEKTLTDILKSLLESSKKKLSDSEHIGVDTYVKGVSRYITLDKISKSYFNVLNRSLYYEKIIDKFLKNVSYEKTVSKNEFVKLDSEEKSLRPENVVNLKHKSLKELVNKRFHANVSEILEQVSKSYEENVINKMGLISHVIKLQSKTSEVNILTKAGSFVENIIKNSVPKILRLETELINKTVDTSKIDELTENIVLNRQQYLSDRTHQERNISRAYVELKKLYSSKNLLSNIKETLKSTNIQSLNIKENINENLLKSVSKKDITNKFKNIYDHISENVSVSNVSEKIELVNREFVKHTSEEEKTSINDAVNLKHSGMFIDRKFINDIRENNILMRDIRIRRKNYERIHKNSEKLNAHSYEYDNFKSTDSSISLINLRKFSTNNFEDYFLKQKNIFTDRNKKSILANKNYKIIENIENKIKKEIVSVTEKEIHEKVRITFDKENLRLLSRNTIKPAVASRSSDGKETQVWDKEDIYKFVPIHIKENFLNEDTIENIFSKNIVNVLSPKFMRSKSFKLHKKNIHKDLIENRIEKYAEKSYDLKKEYRINERELLSKGLQYNHIHQNYMIYKELENYEKNEKHAEKIKNSTQNEKEPDIVMQEKSSQPEIIDTKAIEKSIMDKTLNKKDVVALIESYISDINVENISRNVIGKVERKLMMDKRRNGIF